MTAPATEALPVRTKGCCEELPAALPAGDAARMAALFKALGDPTRLQMLHMLREKAEPICVCDFTAVFQLGQPTVSHHLARLRDAGLVSCFKSGIWTFYRLEESLPAEVGAVLDVIP